MTLVELGLKPLIEELYLFLDLERRVIVIFYIDDFLVLYYRLYSVYNTRIECRRKTRVRVGYI